ncbi:TonB-dependent receptor [candidate division KSB1 bacterium]|nr:TonB-dependent receptor [candidate division KSB1 bacterium]
MIIERKPFCWKFILYSWILLLLSTNLLLAGATGKISGRITDARTGEALSVAEVLLTHIYVGNQAVEMSPPKGAAADMDGRFVLLNVNPGKYNVQVRMMGYTSKIIPGVRVSINRTTPLNVSLDPTVIEGEAVTVTAPRDLIKRDMTSSIKTVSADDMEKFNLESVGAVVQLQPGVVEGHFRGGRADEVIYLIDGIQSGLSLHADAVQEIEVISGTFNAEYGKAMSGIVNVAPKEGSATYTGSLKLFTSNWLTNYDYIGLDKSDIFHGTEARFHLAGPIPFTRNNIKFYMHGTTSDSKGLYYGIRRYNMWDMSLISTSIPREDWIDIHTGDMAKIPMSQSQSYQLMTNLVWRAPLNLKLSLLHQYQYSEGQAGYNHSYKYTPDRTNQNWSENQSIAFAITHTLGERAFHEFRALYADYWSQSSRYKDPYDNRYVHDKYSTSMGGFATGGNDKGFSYNDNKRLELKYDLTWQLTSHHEIKLGTDFVKLDFAPYSFTLQNKWKNTEYEATRYEPVIWADTTIYSNRYEKTPYEFSAYLQDKSEYNKLVINYGLRYDWFDPKTIYPTDIRNPANRIVGSRKTEYADAEPQYQLSPRLGLSYQVADVAALHFSYGHFFQIPGYGSMYQNPDYKIASVNYGSTIGNPNIKAEKTVKYELGLQLEVLEGMVLNTTVFYHDIYNLETIRPIETYDAIIFGYYVNKDYAMSKGLTLGLDYITQMLSFNLAYTLQYAEGNASEPGSNFYKAADNIDPISKFVPLDWDQRHTFNMAVGYNTPKFGASFISRLGSGTRYTLEPYDKSRLALINIPENSMTKPRTIYADLTAYYNLTFLKMGNITPQLGFYIYNIFDHRNEIVVYNDSGRSGSTLTIEDARDDYISTFTTIEDLYYRPNYYSAPRSWKLELGISF